MKTIVLVHGSFQGAYAWDILSSMLKEKGHNVIAPELPGHGRNEADFANISYNDYTQTITDVMNNTPGKLVLVGHSLGGLIITSAAEQLPHKAERLIYVTGLVPDNGSSLIDIGSRDPNSLWGEIIEPSDNPYELHIKKDEIIPVLYSDVPADMQPLVLDNYHAEPVMPYTQPIAVSNEFWDQIPRHYVFCKNDRSISLTQQQNLVDKAGITSVYALDSGHTPQLSMPAELLSIILRIIEE